MSEDYQDDDLEEQPSPQKQVKQQLENSNSEGYEDETKAYRNPQGETPIRPDTTQQNKRMINNKLQNSQSQPELQVSPNKHRPIVSSNKVLDELTEYAMAREGIELKDIQPKSFEEFLKECNGNAKLAQMRYEFKEAERQNLLQDIEERKKYIQLELEMQNAFSYPTTIPNSQIQNRFYQTQQPFLNSRFSKMSQSHSQLPSQTVKSMKNNKEVDNKIFANMLKNQVDQEIKLRSIKERQDIFLTKSQQIQHKRQKEIEKKQEYMHQKQLQKEEKLRKQEALMRQVQEQTIERMKVKIEITEKRQVNKKSEVQQKLHQQEVEHEKKRQHALEIFHHQQEQLQEKQKDVVKKEKFFTQKQLEKQKMLQQYIQSKRQKKEQILRSVQEQKEYEDQKRIEKFLFNQQLELEKEHRIKFEKQKMQERRKKFGEEKNQRMQSKIEEAYRKMEDWTQELEKREKAAADNLKKQQKILQEKLAMKREMLKLRQESAQLKQKRKEMKERLKKDEQLQKLLNIGEKIDMYNQDRQITKHQKQQQLFAAEQKRADMRTAFYHMAVWNVQEAQDIIQEILNENDLRSGSVKPISVAEKVRIKAAQTRRQERLGLNSKMNPLFEREMLDDISEKGQEHQGYQFDERQSQEKIQRNVERQERVKEKQQRVVYDDRQIHS